MSVSFEQIATAVILAGLAWIAYEMWRVDRSGRR